MTNRILLLSLNIIDSVKYLLLIVSCLTLQSEFYFYCLQRYSLQRYCLLYHYGLLVSTLYLVFRFLFMNTIILHTRASYLLFYVLFRFLYVYSRSYYILLTVSIQNLNRKNFQCYVNNTQCLYLKKSKSVPLFTASKRLASLSRLKTRNTFVFSLRL